MATGTDKVKAKLAALTSSFDDLEALLEPLFSQTLPETLVGLEPLQQAKLQTVLPYLVYDLIFIYLKSRGIDPKTHPVIPELDRIRQYFEKISNAENPPAKRTEIDKAAASRFIKHAIAQAQWKKTAAEEMQEDDGPSAATSSAPRVPAKITQKMRERAEYEKEVKEQDARGSEDDELEVFEDEEQDNKMDVDMADRSMKGKGKEIPADTMLSSRNKRRRPAIDPFTGLKDEGGATESMKRMKSASPSPPTIPLPSELSNSSSSTPPASSAKAKTSSKKSKKKSKKQ